MNKPDNTILINGVAADYINVNDRAVQYGDGLFETILCNRNKLLYWKQHYQRLLSSSKRLHIRCPEETLLLADIKTLLEGLEHSADKVLSVKIILSRGNSRRGYQFDKSCAEKRIVMLATMDEKYSSFTAGKLCSGDLLVCEQHVSINESLAGLKHLNRLENVLARNEWRDSSSIIDGLMLNANGHVIEGTMSNLFAVKDNKLLTPDLKYSGVNGIIRDIIIDVAVHAEIEVSIQNIKLEGIYEMDEIFISNSLIGIKAVSHVADYQYSKNDITTLLFKELLETQDKYAHVL